MILYFVNRNYSVLGMASTRLSGDYIITEDTKKEEVETGIATLDCTIAFTDDTRADIENWCHAGNYVLAYYGKEGEKSAEVVNLFMILDTELSVLDKTIQFTAEDSGIDLLNNLAEKYTGTSNTTVGDYVTKFLKNTGFRLRNNTVTANPKKLEWTSTDTVTKRLEDIAEQFDSELAYGFEVKGLSIVDRWVDIADAVGKDTQINLYINKQVNNITIKKTIENLATAVYATGKDSLTLKGFTVPSEDKEKYEIDPLGNLISLEAMKKWKRANYSGTDSYDGNLYQNFESSDTTSQADLYKLAKKKLDSISDIETNYEVDIADLPEGVGIGDRVNIVDDAGNTYISGRILELETSVTDGTKKATLGEYVIKESGISELVENLASSFATLSKVRELYTWIAYADTIDGDGFSFSPEGKEYLGTAVNQLTEEPGTDPAVYKWVKTKGEQGEQGEQGEKGDDGISPVVTLSEETDGTTKIVVTDTEGEKSTTLEDAYARTVATAYITQDESTNNIMIANNQESPTTATANNVLITEKDVQIRNGQKTVAAYGSSVIIGSNEESSIHIGSSGIDMMDDEESLIKISRNEEKTPEKTNDLVKVVYDAESDSYIAKSTYMVGDTITDGDVQLYGFYYDGDTPSSGAHKEMMLQEEYGMKYELLTDAKHILVKMKRQVWEPWCEDVLRVNVAEELASVKILMVYLRLHNGAMLTMGKRCSNEQFDQMQGENSISVGEENVAGNRSIVLGEFSDAEHTSIAVGNNSSANFQALAVGNGVSASNLSAAIGLKVHTSEAYQLVIGTRNNSATALKDDSAVFIVGNGKDPLAVDGAEESNSAVITKKGNLRLAGDVYVNCNNDSTGGVPLSTITSGTGEITLTTGAVEFQPRWWRCGNLVQMEIAVKCTGSVASGANIAAGKITGVPAPITKTGVRGVSYYGNNANISYMGSDGTFYARNAGADALAGGNNCVGGFTFITDGTML